jgi:hypothetical protein
VAKRAKIGIFKVNDPKFRIKRNDCELCEFVYFGGFSPLGDRKSKCFSAFYWKNVQFLDMPARICASRST